MRWLRASWRRSTALAAAAGMLLLAGCGDEAPSGDQAGDELTEEPAEEPTAPDGQDLADPNEDVEDGLYRGNGVILPVPDGWSLDPAAFAQGLVVAVSAEGDQQMSAQAIDAEQAAAAGGSVEFDSLLDGLRQQIEQEPEIDEEVDVAGAERAHRLTYLGLPPQQPEAPEVSVTLVLADDGDGLLGEFVLSAATGVYDADTADLLVEEAGFDPDSEPPATPAQPQPGP